MNVIGITAEYNPFHTGHGFQIRESRRLLGGETAVAAVMSGNWIQQADCAIADKWTRARLALIGGADLVLELPTVWATASAEAFCRGAVSILNATGVVDHLSFGSECGSVEALSEAVDALDSPEFPSALAGILDRGLSFPAARQEAVRQLGCSQSGLLSGANNNLGVEYLRALKLLGSSITPMTVTRQGAGHNTVHELHDLPYLSATQIRQALRSGNAASVANYLVPGSDAVLKADEVSSRRFIERAMLARLRTMTADRWALLPDSGAAEGLPQRLERAAMQSRSMEEFFTLAKTKRYTHARLRRLALWAYLGITAEQIPETPPYIRVLGFNDRGRALMKQMKKTASLPIITKPAHARTLPPEARRLFELEARCTDLYDLCLPDIPAPGREWTTNPVMLGEDL